MRYAKKPLSKTAVVFVFSQFPMGKVKLLVEITLVLSFLVSIPYGKGKGKAKASFAMAAAAYQFPMGKVKYQQSICMSPRRPSINSLWER